MPTAKGTTAKKSAESVLALQTHCLKDRLAAAEKAAKLEADKLAAAKKAEVDKLAATKKAEAGRLAAAEEAKAGGGMQETEYDSDGQYTDDDHPGAWDPNYPSDFD